MDFRTANGGQFLALMILTPKKAFLLAAGHGTRLRPLTDTTPKCLLPICGVPILQSWLDRCRRFGIEDVLVTLHSYADALRESLQHNKPSGHRASVSDEPDLRGGAGTIRT